MDCFGHGTSGRPPSRCVLLPVGNVLYGSMPLVWRSLLLLRYPSLLTVDGIESPQYPALYIHTYIPNADFTNSSYVDRHSSFISPFPTVHLSFIPSPILPLFFFYVTRYRQSRPREENNSVPFREIVRLYFEYKAVQAIINIL